MVVLILGLAFVASGLVLLFLPGIWWWDWFVLVLKGSLPPILVLCGLAAIAVGISSVRDKAAAGRQDESKPAPPDAPKPKA